MVTIFPVKYKRHRTLTYDEIYDIEIPPETVWEVCPYLTDKKCEGCKVEEKDEGKSGRLCYFMAEEACKVVIAMQRKHGNNT